MSIWSRLREFLSSVSRTGSGLAEAVATFVAGNPETRRKVAFSIAMIALSAKMAKADGVVSQKEVEAFRQIFSIPEKEVRNVARLYDLAKQDVAGFEAYAQKMAKLCGSGHRNCAMLSDILDGLFHIAKADGVLHEREDAFLRRIAEIFHIDEAHYQAILARHVDFGSGDPYRVLDVEHGAPLEKIRRKYRKLVAENHPDRLIARGVPEEFVALATARLAAINTAYEMIERALRAA